MKYLIVEDFTGNAIPFIFPRRVDHVDMREQLPYSKILSAGFLDMEAEKIHCYGGNAELCLQASDADVDVIREALRHR